MYSVGGEPVSVNESYICMSLICILCTFIYKSRVKITTYTFYFLFHLSLFQVDECVQ